MTWQSRRLNTGLKIHSFIKGNLFIFGAIDKLTGEIATALFVYVVRPQFLPILKSFDVSEVSGLLSQVNSIRFIKDEFQLI